MKLFFALIFLLSIMPVIEAAHHEHKSADGNNPFKITTITITKMKRIMDFIIDHSIQIKQIIINYLSCSFLKRK